MEEGTRRLAAIMFTDMVGYTALTQSNEAQAMEVLQRHNKLLRPIFPKYRGREVKAMGDSFLVEFDSALDAVNCAVEVQRFLHDYNISSKDGWKITLRIGIHLGDVVHSAGDVFGDAVNIASRLQPLAEPDGVCISEQMFDQVRNKITQSLVKLDPHEMKGVKFAVDVYKVVMPWESKEAPSLQDKKRIAVLPLSNISHDQSDEYFADGMTEELINALSHVQGLKVIARTSVTRYKGNPKSVSEIGRELGVGSVLEGSVRKAGDRVRVTAQLIDVPTEEHLWSENYDRKVEDIFAIQSDVAGMVADALKTKLLTADRKRLESGYTTNAGAYDRYLLGRHSGTRDWSTRLRYFEEAISLDPNFAQALAAIADYYIQLSGDHVPLEEAFSKARAYIERAMELDDHLPDVWTAKSDFLFQYEWDAKEAERCLKRAIELNPNYADAYAYYSYTCCATGRYEEAIQLSLKGKMLDPYPARPLHLANLSQAYALAGKQEDALREIDRMREMYPNNPDVRLFRAQTYGLLGIPEKAVAELEQLRAETKTLREKGTKGWTAGVPPGFLAMSMFSYAALGRDDRVKEMIEEAEGASRTEPVSLSTLGFLYLAAAEMERAFEAFEKSLKDRDPGLFMYSHLCLRLMKQVPNLSVSVTSDRRFLSLLQKAGVRLMT